MPSNNEDKKTSSFSYHVKRLARALEKEDSIYIDYLTDFVEEFPPSTSYEIVKNNEEIIKSSKILDLVIDNVLPATFASLFLKTIKLLSYVDEYELEIYASDGVSKILYAMKENITDSEIQILGCQLHSYLTLDDAVREALGEEEESIKQIIATINQFIETSDEVLSHAFRSLTNICFENNLNKQIVLREGLDIIMQSAKRSIDNPFLLCDIIIFIRNVINDEECKYKLKDEGIIEFLIECLNKYKDTEYTNLLEHIIWAFIIYITGSDSNKEDIVDRKIIPTILSIIQQYSSTPNIINSICILLLLLSKLSKSRKEIISLNGIIHIIGIFDNLEDISCIENACKLLERLVINKSVREDIINNHANIIAKLLQIMKDNINSVNIHFSSVKFFLRLLSDSNHKICIKTSDIIKANQGISTLVASMNTHHNEVMKNRICDILNILLTGPEGASNDSADSESNEEENYSSESSDDSSSDSSCDESQESDTEGSSNESENDDLTNINQEDNIEEKATEIVEKNQDNIKLNDDQEEYDSDEDSSESDEEISKDSNIVVKESDKEISKDSNIVKESSKELNDQNSDKPTDSINDKEDSIDDKELNNQPLTDENQQPIRNTNEEEIKDSIEKDNKTSLEEEDKKSHIPDEDNKTSTNEVDSNFEENKSAEETHPPVRPRVNDLIRKFSSSSTVTAKKNIVVRKSRPKPNIGKDDSVSTENKEKLSELQKAIVDDESTDPKTKIRGIFSFWKEKASKK